MAFTRAQWTQESSEKIVIRPIWAAKLVNWQRPVVSDNNVYVCIKAPGYIHSSVYFIFHPSKKSSEKLL